MFATLYFLSYWNKGDSINYENIVENIEEFSFQCYHITRLEPNELAITLIESLTVNVVIIQYHKRKH